MIEDHSYGIIPYRQRDGVREFLLVRHKAGHWGFPKGHPEKGEEAVDTARRELEEETGIAQVEVDPKARFEERYVFTKRKSGKRVMKHVCFFLGRVGACDVRPQEGEIEEVVWGDEAQTRARITFQEGRELLDRVRAYLEEGISGARR